MQAARNLHYVVDERKSRNVRARHAEVARRYAWHSAQCGRKCPRGSPALICRVRLRELERLYQRRYGAVLPYDDAGLDDLTIAAHHIAHMGSDAVGHIVAWARARMPEMPLRQAQALAEGVAANPRRFKAATLAWRLRLTNEERSTLNIATIRAVDVTDAEMAECRKRKARERDAARRQRQRSSRPAKPEPLCRTRPWETLGMSRATWYRRCKPTPETAPPDRETKPAAQQVTLATWCAGSFVSPPSPVATAEMFSHAKEPHVQVHYEARARGNASMECRRPPRRSSGTCPTRGPHR
jgi:hypothetical protein